MASRNELINEMLKKMFEYSGNVPPYEDLLSTKDKWRDTYYMSQEAKIKWFNWGMGFIQQRLGVSPGRLEFEMQALDNMYGLKTY